MKVFVVMGNDFPDAVFTTEAAAEAYCQRKITEQNEPHPGRRIHWRAYSFELRETSFELRETV